MTTIVELSPRIRRNIRKIIDNRAEFSRDINRSQMITYTLEYFSDCFTDVPQRLKAIHIVVYLLDVSQRPEITHYVISWEDLPRESSELWNEFQSKVDQHLRGLVKELRCFKAIEESSIR